MQPLRGFLKKPRTLQAQMSLRILAPLALIFAAWMIFSVLSVNFLASALVAECQRQFDSPRAASNSEAPGGDAPLDAAGWRLGIEETLRFVSALFIAVGLALIGMVMFVIRKSIGRVAAPLNAIQEQTRKLVQGENIEPLPESGIVEIDALENETLKMAARISSYQSGLHRYVVALTKSQEDERRRIARELHDETAQSLLVISRRLELLLSAEQDPQRREQYEELRHMVSETLAEVRQINRDLRPLMLEDLGLIPALTTLVRAARQGEGALPHARFETTGQPIPLSAVQELALFRITQETLANVRKHARATGVSVNLTFAPETIQLTITDDGQGFVVPPALFDFAQQDCFGLVGVQERVLAVGGSLSIQSAPGEGTKVTVTFPVMDPAP
jgi:signal transduction histidine kinase